MAHVSATRQYLFIHSNLLFLFYSERNTELDNQVHFSLTCRRLFTLARPVLPPAGTAGPGQLGFTVLIYVPLAFTFRAFPAFEN